MAPVGRALRDRTPLVYRAVAVEDPCMVMLVRPWWVGTAPT